MSDCTDIDEGTSVKNSVQSSITRVVGQNSINCAGICASMSSREGHVIRGLSCWFRNLIQVIHMGGNADIEPMR